MLFLNFVIALGQRNLCPGPIGFLVGVSAWSFCSCEAVCLSHSWRCHLGCLWFPIFSILDLGGVGVTHGKVEAGKILCFFCCVYLDVVSAFPYASLGLGPCIPIGSALLVVSATVAAVGEVAVFLAEPRK